MRSEEVIAPTPQERGAGLEDSLACLSGPNPFASNAVSDPSGADADAPGIHDRAFQELRGHAEEVLRELGHQGHVVWGEAGIGKSHLLARLCRWADREGGAVCVFLHNIQPRPELLPRYVVKCVVQRLIRGQRAEFCATPLYHLVAAGLRRAFAQFPPPKQPPTARQALAAYRRFIDRRLRENPNAGVEAQAIHDVLFRFYLDAFWAKRTGREERLGALAARWLSGDELERGEAGDLELRLDDETDELVSLPDNPAIESVLIALADLASLRGQTLVLCFDQVDNLSREQMQALTQFLHPLIDHSRNLLVVLSGVQQKILDFVKDGAILQAAWERLAQNPRGIQLTRISRNQARQILDARLQRFFEPFMIVPEVKDRIALDPLFPLGSARFEQWLGNYVELRPRDVVNWARDRWREEQTQLRAAGPAAWFAEWPERHRAAPAPPVPPPLADEELQRRIDDEIAGKMAEQIGRRELEPDTLPPDAANLSGLVEALLRQCLASGAYGLERIEHPKPTRPGRLPVYHLLAVSRRGSEERCTGLTFVVTESAVSMARSLGRIADDSEPPDRLLLVYERRDPLKLGDKGKEYLERLQDRGPERFLEIGLSFREYAELDALEAVLGDARSGDLEITLADGSTRRITEPEVIASHHRQNRYCRHPLLKVLLLAPLP